MFKRFRRLRSNEIIRSLVRETIITPDDFIYPLFVREGEGIKQEVSSMPNVFHMSIDEILNECEELQSLGLKSILLFGIPESETRDAIGSTCMSDDSIVAKAIKAIKVHYPDIFIITDLCFCEYTDHGHCGVLDPKTGSVDNDKTLQNAALQALVHAKAGADMIAPSGMMDGIVQTLRNVLDQNGFENIPIMSYSTKFASAFYGPFFQDVTDSPLHSGDKRTNQLDIANRLESIEESLEDERQGADILMVKPALNYLDIVRDIKNHTRLPLAVYNVSGEYAMLKLAGKYGLINYEQAMMERLIGMKRAGADLIITYHAKEACKLLTLKI